jgi:asparagine synthetase B (glutamine-hydrolysing)
VVLTIALCFTGRIKEGIQSLERRAMKANVKKVVLAYSGGLDTSCIVPWLKENYGCEVITFTANVGQGDEELEGLEEKAIASGASKAYVVDLRKEFLTEYAFPTMKAGAIYEHLYLLGTSFAPNTWSRLPGRRARIPSLTAAPARATTRCALS